MRAKCLRDTRAARQRRVPGRLPRAGGLAAGQHAVDRAQHRLAALNRRLVLAQRDQVLALERPEERDDLLGFEVVVVVDRRAPRLQRDRLRLGLHARWLERLRRFRAGRRGRPGVGRQELLQLAELRDVRHRRALALLAVAAHVWAPAQELLDLALVAVRLPDAGKDGLQAQMLAELLDGLARRVAVAEAGCLEAAVVPGAPQPKLGPGVRPDDHTPAAPRLRRH